MTDTAGSALSAPSSLDLLDELEALIGEGRRVPFSASVVVNEDDMLELIDRARLGLPQELVEARHTVSDRDRILASAEDESEQMLSQARAEAESLLAGARAEAGRLVAEAQARAEQLTAEHEITRSARERADALTVEAEGRAAEVTAEADAYARRVMEEMDAHLDRALQAVRKGLEVLPGTTVEHGRKRRGRQA